MNPVIASHYDLLPAFHHAENAYDPGTARHSTRVGYMSALIAEALGLNPDDVEAVTWAGILHDLGKLAVPGEILHKNGPLDFEEAVRFERHPVVGADLMLAISQELAPIADAIRTHHEHWNGTGYPHGLVGQEIPLFGRIVCIADVFDAATRRAGGGLPPLNETEAAQYLMSNGGSLFDPKLVAVFVDLHRQGLVDPSDYSQLN